MSRSQDSGTILFFSKPLEKKQGRALEKKQSVFEPQREQQELRGLLDPKRKQSISLEKCKFLILFPFDLKEMIRKRMF
jgi:hypothetical protein